jgi:hypothetical protein
MRTQYHVAGFRILEWMNYSDKAIEHYEQMLSATPKLTAWLIFGDDAPERQRNSQRNLIERRTIFWMITEKSSLILIFPRPHRLHCANSPWSRKCSS